MEETFIRNRITELRINKGISEYQLSLALGKSQGYIQSISSSRTLPSMHAFLEICNYFEMTPQDFFDYDNHRPKIHQEILDKIKMLSDDDIDILSVVLDKFVKCNNEK